MTDSEELAHELMRALMPRDRRGPHFRMNNWQNSSEFSMLFHIGRLMKEGKTDEIGPSALSELLQISRPSVTSTLNALEQKSLIERIPDRADRRKTLITLTKNGKALLDERYQHILSGFQYITARMGEEKIRQLIALLTESFKYMEEFHKNVKNPEI